jgi:hypothetical protein
MSEKVQRVVRRFAWIFPTGVSIIIGAAFGIAHVSFDLFCGIVCIWLGVSVFFAWIPEWS